MDGDSSREDAKAQLAAMQVTLLGVRVRVRVRVSVRVRVRVRVRV